MINKPRVLIIGMGVVGHNMLKLFPWATTCDPIKKCIYTKTPLGPPCTYGEKQCPLSTEPPFSVGFICVPTDMLSDGSADISIVQKVIKNHSEHCEVLCIKSTVPPGTTKRFEEEGYSVVFSPEYWGGTAHANSPDYDFVILGGNRKYTNQVAEVYQEIFPANLRILQTDPLTAELVKYGENAWIATKVTFCNEMYRICKQYDVDYREWRELWLADPRINRAHTFVYDEHPWARSHCLDKDVPAIIQASAKNGYYPRLLALVHELNQYWSTQE